MLNRRNLIFTTMLAGLTAPAWAAATNPVAATGAGMVSGKTIGGVAVFKGISYGAPTSGAARFLPPAKPQSWTGVRAATAYGDGCPQEGGVGAPPPPGTPLSPIQKKIGELFGTPGHETFGENCLFLNVWTPQTDNRKRPVMVWLHGGGFSTGSGSWAAFDGTPLATKGDVVVVTINHRLNVFGFLYLGEIGGTNYASSGNVGMLDIVAALQWVRDNIAAFGGNPGNVTIFGESGGGGKVSVLCAMPAAEGLFHRAIIQSGATLDVSNKERATALARVVMAELGVTTVEQLQQVETSKLLQAGQAAEHKTAPMGPLAGMGFMPLVDDVVLNRNPFDPDAPPESAHVPIMVGTNKDEAVLFLAGIPGFGTLNDEQARGIAAHMAGPNGAKAYDFYKSLNPTRQPSFLLSDIVTDQMMRQNANKLAERKARQGAAPVWLYVLEWPAAPQIGTPHVTDVPLVFGTIATSPLMTNSPTAKATSNQMMHCWISFARGGDPNNPAVPHWDAYDSKDRAAMVFNATSHEVFDYDKPIREFWERG